MDFVLGALRTLSVSAARSFINSAAVVGNPRGGAFRSAIENAGNLLVTIGYVLKSRPYFWFFSTYQDVQYSSPRFWFSFWKARLYERLGIEGWRRCFFQGFMWAGCLAGYIMKWQWGRGKFRGSANEELRIKPGFWLIVSSQWQVHELAVRGMNHEIVPETFMWLSNVNTWIQWSPWVTRIKTLLMKSSDLSNIHRILIFNQQCSLALYYLRHDFPRFSSPFHFFKNSTNWHLEKSIKTHKNRIIATPHTSTQK